MQRKRFVLHHTIIVDGLVYSKNYIIRLTNGIGYIVNKSLKRINHET